MKTSQWLMNSLRDWLWRGLPQKITTVALLSVGQYCAAQSWATPTFDPVTHAMNAGWPVAINSQFNDNHDFSVNQLYTDPNGFKWKARHDPGRYSEWFSKDNLEISGGYLKLWGTFQDCPSNVCTSGNIKSFAGAELIAGDGFGDVGGNTRFGFYETKMKLPVTGAFVAWWLSQKNGSGAYKQHPPEIDMMEAIHPNLAAGVNDEIEFNGQPYHYNVDDNPGWNFNSLYRYRVPITNGVPSSGYSAITTYFNSFHVYGFLWTPDILQMYIDGQPFGTAISMVNSGLSIQVALRMVFSVQLHAQDMPATEAQLMSSKFEIDYVKYMLPPNGTTFPKRWCVAWNNEDFSSSANTYNPSVNWTASATDILVSGNFRSGDNSTKEQLVVLKSATSGSMLTLANVAPPAPNSSQTASWDELDLCSTCGGLAISSNSKVLAGNFDGTTVEDEILLQAFDGRIMKLSGSPLDWAFVAYGPLGYGQGGGASTDKFIAIDVDGNATDELMRVTTSGLIYIYSYSGGAWTTLWNNIGTPGVLPTVSGTQMWNMASSDQYIAGDFTGGAQDELLIFSSSGYIKMFQFGTGNWTQLWGAGTPGQAGYVGIGGFYTAAGDKYLVADWDDQVGDNGKEEVVAVSPSGQYVKILNYSNGNWASNWGNNGSWTIVDWWLRSTDKLVAGNFITDPNCTSNGQLMMVRGEYIPYTTSHKWRGNLYISPLSSFWNSSLALKATQTEIETAETIYPSGITIFPNPSSGHFEVQGELDHEDRIVCLRARSIDGRIIAVSNSNQIDLSEQPTGMYLIEVTFATRQPVVLKALKR